MSRALFYILPQILPDIFVMCYLYNFAITTKFKTVKKLASLTMLS